MGLLLSPQILDKVLGGQHFSRSEDKQDWAGKIMGPDDLGPRQAGDGNRQRALQSLYSMLKAHGHFLLIKIREKDKMSHCK